LHFTVTNDDGYEATGLAVLVGVARRFGTVQVVAPTASQSQTGHAVSLNQPLALRSIHHTELGPTYAVLGKPADCARLAVAGLAGSQRPDWLLSGINQGANLGVDVFYSGTVAAAREAAILGTAAISFSQFIRRPQPVDWNGAAVMTERVLREILGRGCPAGTYYNVNLPALESGFEDVPIVDAPRGTDPLPLAYEPIDPPPNSGPRAEGFQYYRYTASYAQRIRAVGSDVEVAFSGRISLSRLTIYT